MIIYASVADISIGKLFIAGIIPGLMLAASYSVTVWIVSIRRNYAAEHVASTLRDKLARVVDASWAFVLPVIIVGGIRFGVFTATEAASIGVLYSLFVGTVVYRELTLRKLPGILMRAARETGVVMLIVAAFRAIRVVFGS